MDVLLLGPEGADIEATARTLARAGHEVHRCCVPTGEAETSAPCVGALHHGSCPLEHAIDVALVVGDGARSDGVAPIGLGCAVRDLVPIASLPFGGNPVDACRNALGERDAGWTDRLRISLGSEDVSLSSTRRLDTLHLTVNARTGQTEPAVVSRLATRAYEVVRDDLPAGFRSVDVAVAAVAVDVAVGVGAGAGAGATT